MRLVFDGRALAALEAVYDWIAKDNPSAAKAVVDRMFESIEHLAAHPRMAMRAGMPARGMSFR